MRHGLLTLLLIALAVLAAVSVADTESEVTIDVDGNLQAKEQEVLEKTKPSNDDDDASEVDPRLTPIAIANVFSKLSAKCLKQVQEMDPTNVSDRCRREVTRRVHRYLERLDKDEKNEMDAKNQKDKTSKGRSRKNKKQTRAQRAAQEKIEWYQRMLQFIFSFIVTFVVVIAGALFFFNRKLKAAGLYYPELDAEATCCD